MRSEAEIREAIAILEDAQRGAAAAGDMESVHFTASQLDVLRWMVGDDSSMFQAALIDPAREKRRALQAARAN